MQFDDKNKCTFLVKLDLLYEFEEQLFKQDKKRKENTWTAAAPRAKARKTRRQI